jgi:TonB family protein
VGGVPGGAAGVGVVGGVVGGVSASSPVHAEDKTGTVSGTVFDPSGARVPQAGVAIINKATGAKNSTEANDTGDFFFTDLQPGTYTLNVTKSGFGIYARTVVLNAQNAAPPLDIVLQPGDVLQAIDVTATRPPSATSAPREHGPKRIRVGGLIQSTKLTAMKKPEYPESARAKGIEGVVLLQAVISIKGEPLSLKVISSPDPDLSEAAEDAVHQWRYQPTLLNGEPIEVVTTVAVRFHLED